MRRAGDSPSAAVSPLVKPMRTSLTTREGDVKVPSFRRRPVSGAAVDPSRGGGVGLVPKRGSAGWGVPVLEGTSLGGVCHAPSLAASMMSSTVSWGAARLAYASSGVALGSKFCQICVGRCVPAPHLGASRSVEGPIMASIYAERGDLSGVSHMNPIPPLWVETRWLMRRIIC